MKKVIGVVPSSSLGDMTKSNMSDHYKVGNNYTKRVDEAGCVPVGLAPVDNWLDEAVLDLCDGFVVQGGAELYPYQAFYYFRAAYATHPNVYISERFDAQWDYCDSIKEEPWEKQMEEAYKLEMIYLEDVVNVPVIQNVAYTLFSERLVVPMQTYIPGFGWGTNYGDIVE